MHPDADKLFADEALLRAEADDMLARSGIGAILRAAGYRPVGSYVMRVMTWRDLDFEREEKADWQRHWEVGTQLANTGWFWRLNCVNAYQEEGLDRPHGLYWGLRLSDPSQRGSATDAAAAGWKMDLWTFEPAQEKKLTAARATWSSLMTEESRAEILAIKQSVCAAPEFRKTLLSAHIYEAVLEHGICGLDKFWEWWRGRPY